MREILVNIPIPFTNLHLPIHTYGVMLMIGFLVALFLARRRARRAGVDPMVMVDIALVALCAGVLGARLFYVIENSKTFFAAPGGLLRAVKIWDGGLVFYGGFLVAALAVILLVRAKKLPLARMLDVIAPSTMVGLAFGRMGCFLNSCCYGKPTDLPWCVVFPPNSLPYKYGGIPHGTPLHPTQIYSAFTAVVLYVILEIYFDRHKRDGMVAILLCMIYPLNRFLLEVLRADTAVPGGLTVSQVLSIVVFAVALGFWVVLRLLPPRGESALSRSVRRAAERHRPKSEGPEGQG